MKPKPIDFLIPVATTDKPAGNYQATASRQLSERLATTAAMDNVLTRASIPLPCVVTLTRIGPGTLPPDGLEPALEVIARQIRRQLNCASDRDVRFLFEQRPPFNAKACGVKVTIRSQPAPATGREVSSFQTEARSI